MAEQKNTTKKPETPEQLRERARAEFERQTECIYFAKVSHTHLAAKMHDQMETAGARVWAWITLRSWGERALFCITPDGRPAHQSDCAAELNLDKTTVSHCVYYFVQRGYLAKRGKLLYPVISPTCTTPDQDPKKLRASATFATFLESWKVANASNFARWEKARATVQKYRKVVLIAYKKSQAAERKTAANLIQKTAETVVSLKGEQSAPAAGLQSSSSNRKKSKNLSVEGQAENRTPAPPPEYASPREELKAIYHAKTGLYPAASLLDRIEAWNAAQGKTPAQFVDLVRPHIGNTWTNPAGLLSHLAKFGFQEAETASAPRMKPKPKCPTCYADDGRGAILKDGQILACPQCSTDEWREEFAQKEADREQHRANMARTHSAGAGERKQA